MNTDETIRRGDIDGQRNRQPSFFDSSFIRVPLFSI